MVQISQNEFLTKIRNSRGLPAPLYVEGALGYAYSEIYPTESPPVVFGIQEIRDTREAMLAACIRAIQEVNRDPRLIISADYARELMGLLKANRGFLYRPPWLPQYEGAPVPSTVSLF